MNVKNTIEFLYHYYEMTRQAGHTTAMLEGANNTDEPIIVAANEMGLKSRGRNVDGWEAFWRLGSSSSPKMAIAIIGETLLGEL